MIGKNLISGKNRNEFLPTNSVVSSNAYPKTNCRIMKLTIHFYLVLTISVLGIYIQSSFIAWSGMLRAVENIHAVTF
jgi:hypothetical protein